MSNTSRKFNPSWIAVIILVGAFVVSAIRFFLIASEGGSSDEAGGLKVIRVAHWQLEPGFRESMQWAMDTYNALPHVREANVRIEQEPIPERVFNQVMNVHLISGTAPDIATKGETTIIRGNALARFYAPIGEFVNEPNPYNQKAYQSQDLSDELSQSIASMPWRDTFFDGLEGGYVESLSDFFAIPVSTAGGNRVFYNMAIMEAVKAYAYQTFAREALPEWMTDLDRSLGQPDGFLPLERAKQWVQGPSIPETMGEWIFYCAAVQAYAEAEGLEYLVPISASIYPHNNVILRYESEFFANHWKRLDFDLGTTLSSIEVISGFDRKLWDFEDSTFQAYFDFMQTIVSFYPKGFLGLDREQALRRFVMGNAAMITTGGWDAQSILSGIAGRDRPEDRFEVELGLRPMPAEDERWYAQLPMRMTEANIGGGVPLAINKQTPHFDWALDFLKFLSSHRINEEFNQRAGWLPVIVNTVPPDAMDAFVPDMHGAPKQLAMRFDSSDIPSSIRNTWASTIKLFMSGDIDYTGLSQRISEVLDNPDLGVSRAWKISLQKAQDASRANDRVISVERLNATLGVENALSRERSLLYNSMNSDEGISVLRWWKETKPSEPFPTY